MDCAQYGLSLCLGPMGYIRFMEYTGPLHTPTEVGGKDFLRCRS